MMQEAVNAEDISLAQKISILARLTKLESVIKTAIDNSKVPVHETRKLLKSKTPEQVRNTVVFQFMQDLFNEMGLGKLEIEYKKNFTMVLSNKDSPVHDLYHDVKGRKTCYIVGDALADFFTIDLGLPSDVVETECENVGDPSCVFRIDIQPLAVYRIALDDTDEIIIDMIKKGEDINQVSSELNMLDEELRYRIDSLKSFHILEEDMTLTRIGQTYHKYGKSVLDEGHEDFDPPWKVMSSITSKIADTGSFAEALSSSMENKVEDHDIADTEIVNLVDEAERSTSFAQLVSNTLKENKGEDEE